MNLHFVRSLVLVMAGFAVSDVHGATAAAVPGQQEQRVAASFMLAQGRMPTPAEAEQWAKLGEPSIADLISRHRAELQRSPELSRAVRNQASVDAFGLVENQDREGGRTAIYFERMADHVRTLGGDPALYETVLQRAYRLVIRREAYPEEIEYWKRRGTLSYVLLVGCVEDWARRNQPGLMVTSGTPTISLNSGHLLTVRLSPSIATETRKAVGLAPSVDGPQELNPAAHGRNLIAAGGAEVVTSGRIHFLAVGRSR